MYQLVFQVGFNFNLKEYHEILVFLLHSFLFNSLFFNSLIENLKEVLFLIFKHIKRKITKLNSAN